MKIYYDIFSGEFKYGDGPSEPVSVKWGHVVMDSLPQIQQAVIKNKIINIKSKIDISLDGTEIKQIVKELNKIQNKYPKFTINEFEKQRMTNSVLMKTKRKVTADYNCLLNLISCLYKNNKIQKDITQTIKNNSHNMTLKTLNDLMEISKDD